MVDLSAFKVKRTLTNCRALANDPTVWGILEDNIVKTVSSFTIEGDNPKTKEYIIEMCNSEN